MKHGYSYKINGPPVKLRELSVRLRRLTPEEIMLHTKKSSRKRKAEPLTTPLEDQSLKGPQLQKKFKRIWVISDNSDDENSGSDDTSKEGRDNTSRLCEIKCDNLPPGRGRTCTEVRRSVSNLSKICTLCDHVDTNVAWGTENGKNHVSAITGKKQVLKSIEEAHLFEPDRLKRVSNKVGDGKSGNKLKNVGSKLERLKRAPRGNKVTNKASNGRSSEARLMPVIKSTTHSERMCNKIDNRVNVASATVVNSDIERRHVSCAEDDQSSKRHDNNSKDCLPIRTSNQSNPTKELEKELVADTNNHAHELNNTCIGQNSKFNDDHIDKEKSVQFASPHRTVEDSTVSSERSGRKEMMPELFEIASKELNPVKPMETPQKDAVLATNNDHHDLKGKSDGMNVNSKEGPFANEKPKQFASPRRVVESSHLSGEGSGQKEMPPSNYEIASKESHHINLPDTQQRDLVSVTSIECDLKGKTVGKSLKAKNDKISNEKSKQSASTHRAVENTTVSSERRTGPKEMQPTHNETASKELHPMKSPEPQQRDLVSVTSTEHDSKRKSVGKNLKSKDGHVSNEKSKDFTHPHREGGSSPESSERRLGPKEMQPSLHEAASKELHPMKSPEPQQRDLVSVTSTEYDSKRKSVGKNLKSKDGHVINEKSKDFTHPHREGGSSPESSERRLGPKEMQPSLHEAASKELHPMKSPEPQQRDLVSVTSTEYDSKRKSVGKNLKFKDGHVINEKSKDFTHPHRERGSSPESSERRLGPKEMQPSLHEAASKELHPMKSPEPQQRDLVSVTSAEYDSKRKSVGKNLKSKDGHVINEKSKDFTHPHRAGGSSPAPSERRSGPKEMHPSHHEAGSKGSHPMKSPEPQQRDLVLVNSIEHDSKEKSVGKNLKSRDGHVGTERSKEIASPRRTVEKSPVLSERRSGAKEMQQSHHETASKESHPFKSPEPQQKDLVSITKHDLDLKGKSIGMNEKPKDDHIRIEKTKQFATPCRAEESSPLSGEISGPKEISGPSKYEIASKDSHPIKSTETLQKDLVPDATHEHHFKEKTIVGRNRKSKDNCIDIVKSKQLATPGRSVENSPVSCESARPKEVLTKDPEIVSKESNTITFSKKMQKDPISVTTGERVLKGKAIVKHPKSRDDHIGVEKYKVSPHRSMENSPVSSGRCGPREMLQSNFEFVSKEAHLSKSGKPQGDMVSISRTERTLKSKPFGKNLKSKDGPIAYEKSKQFSSVVRAVESTPKLNERSGPMEMLLSNNEIVSKESHPIRSTETLQRDLISVTDHENDLKGKSVGKNLKSKDDHIGIEKPKQFTSLMRAAENLPVSNERSGPEEMLSFYHNISSKETQHIKSSEKVQRDLVPATNQEYNLKGNYTVQNIKFNDHFITSDKSKKLLSQIREAEIEHASSERSAKEKDGQYPDRVANESNPIYSTDSSQKECMSVSNHECDLKRKYLLRAQNTDNCIAIEKSKLHSSPVTAVENTLMLNERLEPKEPFIRQKDKSKCSHLHAGKSQHVSKISALPTVTSPSQVKAQLEVVSTTQQDPDLKEICKRQKEKYKIPSVEYEKLQQLSKIIEGSRRGILKTIRKPSSEEEVSTTNYKQVLEGRLEGPNAKCHLVDVKENSRQISKSTKEQYKTSETNDREVDILCSSVIEKSGGSCVAKSPSAIEADNVEQLMAKYETLINLESSKAPGEKKTDRRLSQRKIRNIFGEDHLVEDSESILSTPISSIPANISANGHPEFFKSASSDFPSLQCIANSGAITSSLVNTEIVSCKSRNACETKEGAGKKRKLSDSENRKKGGKSRRHSMDVSSGSITTGKTSMIRGRVSLDCMDSCSSSSVQRVLRSCKSSFGTNSLVTNSVIDSSSLENGPVMSAFGDPNNGEEPYTNEQSIANNIVTENQYTSLSPGAQKDTYGDNCTDKVKKNKTVGGLMADRHSISSFPGITVNQGEESALYHTENTQNDDLDILIVDVRSIKDENEAHMNAISNDYPPVIDLNSPSTTDSTELDQHDRILVSSPISLATQEGHHADSSQDIIKICVEEPEIAPQVEADTEMGLESPEDFDDLFCLDGKSWSESELKKKLEQVEDNYKRKEEALNRAKVVKEKVLRVWEMSCGIEVLEMEVLKEEPSIEYDCPTTPLIQKSQEVTMLDIKEETDRVSTVSTEILESSDDFQAQQQGEVGSNHDVGLVSSSGTSVEGSGDSQRSLVTDTSASSEGHAVVSSSAVENSTLILKTRINEVHSNTVTSCVTSQHQFSMQEPQKAAAGTPVVGESNAVISCDTISHNHQFSAQEPQNAAAGTSIAGESIIIGQERTNASSEMGNIGAISVYNSPGPREDRIRVRGLNDLLAVPSTEQSQSQNNNVVATISRNVNDPDKHLRDSFDGEEAFLAFKKLQFLLAELGKAYMLAGEAVKTPNYDERKQHFLQLLEKYSIAVCHLCVKVISSFCYSNPLVFASFLYFQISYAMKNHNTAFTLECMKKLIKYTFRSALSQWNPKSRQQMEIYLAKVLRKMGIGPSTQQEILPSTQNATSQSPAGQNNSSILLSQASLQAVTLNNVVLHNQSPHTSSPESSHQTLHAPLTTSNNLPGNIYPSRNAQVQNPPHTMDIGFQEGHIQGRLEVSSTSEASINSCQPKINSGRVAFQVAPAPGLRSFPNVSVNPNQQQRPDVPFVSVRHMSQATHPNLAHLLVGDSVNANHNRVVSGQPNVNHSRVAGGQCNVNQSSALVSQSSNPVQNLVAFTQTFQQNTGHQAPNDQLANQVHIPTSAPSILQNQLPQHMYAPFVTQQASSAPSQQNNTSVNAQSSVPVSNFPQHRRPSQSFPTLNSQKQLHTQPHPGDPHAYYIMQGTNASSSAHPAHVQRPAVQATPLHPPQPAYQPHPSVSNSMHYPSTTYNQNNHVIPQGQVQRNDNGLHNNTQGICGPPPPYFSSVTRSRNISGAQSTVGQGQERVCAQTISHNVGQTTTVLQHSRIEVAPQRRMSADDVLNWQQQQQQQVAHSPSYMNNPISPVLNQALGNHSGIQSYRMTSNSSHITSHSMYSQGSEIQHMNSPSRQAQQSEVRPSIIHSVPRRSMESHTEHTSTTVLTAMTQQLNTSRNSYQPAPSNPVQHHDSNSMGANVHGQSANPVTHMEPVEAATRRQTMLPSVTSPTHRSSPGSLTEENDQRKGKSMTEGGSVQESLPCHSSSQRTSFCKPSKKTRTASKKKHPMKGRGQGLCRPFSNDSGYRSPSQGTENYRDYTALAGVCYSCRQKALLTCSKCQSIYYCSVDCQTKDWRRHREGCRALS